MLLFRRAYPLVSFWDDRDQQVQQQNQIEDWAHEEKRPRYKSMIMIRFQISKGRSICKYDRFEEVF